MRSRIQFNRRVRGRLHRATAGLTLAVWLLISIAEICPSFHAWLHGGSIPDDDNCAVVAIALGHFHSPAAEMPSPMPVFSVEIIPRVQIFTFLPVSRILPNDRAPPIFRFVS